MTEYTVGLYNFSGDFLTPLEYLSMQYARSRRAVGSATIVLPDYYSENIFGRDGVVRIYRRAEGGLNYLEPNAIWFVRKVSHEYKQRTVTLTLADQMTFLERRLVAYKAQSLYADKTFDEGNAPAPADDLMKAYVRENLGTLAVIEETGSPDTDRDLSAYLSVENDRSEAPDVEVSGSYQKLIDVLNNLSRLSETAGTILFFDIAVTGPASYEFRTALLASAADRRESLTFDSHGNNLDELVSEIDYTNEVTVAFIGGDSSGWTKYVRRVIDITRAYLTPFNWIETYFDTNEDHTDDFMDATGNKILLAGKPKKRIRANLVDTPNLRYGRDYFYGDYVNVALGGDIYNCHITSVSNSVGDGKETPSIALEGELSIL